MIVVLCSVLVLLGWGVFRLVRDARRQTRRCDEYFSEIRVAAAPVAPVLLTWNAATDRELHELLETGER